MPWRGRKGEETNLGGDHVAPVLWEKWHSTWPFTSRTLKPTLDQSMVSTGGGGNDIVYMN